MANSRPWERGQDSQYHWPEFGVVSHHWRGFGHALHCSSGAWDTNFVGKERGQNRSKQMQQVT